jgi:SAM-dependent methyltransferase
MYFRTAIMSLTEAWNQSYNRRENFVFWPSDEMVRFVSRHLRRRVGIDEIVDVGPRVSDKINVLDIGCGIGRNLVFGHDMGLTMYGMDLSSVAVASARHWLSSRGDPNPADRIIQGDVTNLPWEDSFFDHGFSESVLDSMPFSIAKAGISEIARVLRPGGFFYCSLISGNETGRPANFSGEVVVDTDHEKGTVQTFFNEQLIDRLIEGHFTRKSLYLTETRVVGGDHYHGRWYFVGQRI